MLDPVGVVSSAQWTMAAAASTTDLNDVRSVDLAVTGAGRMALVDRELPANSKRAVASAATGRERWDHTGSTSSCETWEPRSCSPAVRSGWP